MPPYVIHPPPKKPMNHERGAKCKRRAPRPRFATDARHRILYPDPAIQRITPAEAVPVVRLSRLLFPTLPALFAAALHAQTPAAGAQGPGGENPRIHEIVRAVDPARIESDVRRLAGFG